MARSDLVVNLIRAAALADDKLIRTTVEAIVAEEHAKKHHILAEKLWSIYEVSKDKGVVRRSAQPSLFPSKRHSAETAMVPHDVIELLHEGTPQRGLNELFLDDTVRESCQELIEEQLNSVFLKNNGLEPRCKVVLAGPPGNGKTSLANAIAFELGLPIYTLKYESIIGSFLGETSAKLKRIFDFVRSKPCVVFFDEFDTLGKERGDAHETGEIKRVVSSLLLQIDALPSHNVIIAATNHGELIDRAAWRRFELRLELKAPTPKQIPSLLHGFEASLRVPFTSQTRLLTSELAGLSYSDIEQFLLDVKRRWLLNKSSVTLEEIVSARLSFLKRRFGMNLTTPAYDQPSSVSSSKSNCDDSPKRDT
ncbi:AAA family ATPase [Janthinobacterium sp. SUN137]|uniref:AAA family ATPase n=1 Tax=Janthinobacterium sp. SUN137 TaxID=3014789 RepID=UPI00271322A7|nr:ATP-binding protein [Janthinobacterium sp. SUN137]MDO8042465.1 ATP-binding protein [Janthinobacterium sp. SUN137]